MVQQKILGELVRYFRIPLIVTSIIGNIAVIVVLLRYKVLRRNSSNMLIAQLGFADFVLGVGLLIRGIQNELSISTDFRLFIRYECLLYGATTIFAINLLQVTIIMITLDRLFVIFFPIFYRHHVDDVRVSVARFVISLTFSLISSGGQFIFFPFETTIANCSSGAAWTYGYRFYFMVFTALTSLLTIALTVITIAAYLHQTHVSAQRRENSIVITQTAVMVSYMVFWCVPTIVYLVAMAVGFHANIFGNITLVFSIGSASFASLNPFLFLWKHTEFRTFFIRFYRLRSIFKSSLVTTNVNVIHNTAVPKVSSLRIESASRR